MFFIQKTQFLKSDLQTVWNFMKSPKNLGAITPDYMGFEILSDKNDLENMYAGQIIEYFVKPVLGLKMRWVTEITHVEHLKFFVDEQRFGPYKFWHHKHFLKEVEGGVEMIDIIHYKMPMGFLGKLVNTLFVKKQLNEIFNYRYKKLEAIFNTTSQA